MPKAKTIDRVEYTKNRSIVYTPAPVGRNSSHSDLHFEICPVCGAKLIHESGCVRCTCGWSKC